MVVSIETGCCVCGKPVKIKIEEWPAVIPLRSVRAFCPDCIGKEPKKYHKIAYKAKGILIVSDKEVD